MATFRWKGFVLKYSPIFFRAWEQDRKYDVDDGKQVLTPKVRLERLNQTHEKREIRHKADR